MAIHPLQPVCSHLEGGENEAIPEILYFRRLVVTQPNWCRRSGKGGGGAVPMSKRGGAACLLSTAGITMNSMNVEGLAVAVARALAEAGVLGAAQPAAVSRMTPAWRHSQPGSQAYRPYQAQPYEAYRPHQAPPREAYRPQQARTSEATRPTPTAPKPQAPAPKRPAAPPQEAPPAAQAETKQQRKNAKRKTLQEVGKAYLERVRKEEEAAKKAEEAKRAKTTGSVCSRCGEGMQEQPQEPRTPPRSSPAESEPASPSPNIPRTPGGGPDLEALAPLTTGSGAQEAEMEEPQ